LFQRRNDTQRDTNENCHRQRHQTKLHGDGELLAEDVVHRAAAGTERGSEVHPTDPEISNFDVNQVIVTQVGVIRRGGGEFGQHHIIEILTILHHQGIIQVIAGIQVRHNFRRQGFFTIKRAARDGMHQAEGNEGDNQQYHDHVEQTSDYVTSHATSKK